jgi:hypothetical protein
MMDDTTPARADGQRPWPAVDCRAARRHPRGNDLAAEAKERAHAVRLLAGAYSFSRMVDNATLAEARVDAEKLVRPG